MAAFSVETIHHFYHALVAQRIIQSLLPLLQIVVGTFFGKSFAETD